jgi:hypothetical protein
MKKQINIDQETIMFLYRKNKSYILPISVIVICVFLFLQIIVPQINGLFELQKQLKSEQDKLTMLKKNLTSLSNLDSSVLDSQYNISTSVLPVNKDFAGIINAVSIAAGKTGLSVGDYDFTVGDVSKPQTEVTKFPFLQLSVNLLGNISSGSRFITELNKTAPLSEVVSLSSSSNSISVGINFYYKTIPPVNFKEENPIQMLSSKSQAVFDNISNWSNISTFTSSSAPSASASSSGTTNPMPF